MKRNAAGIQQSKAMPVHLKFSHMRFPKYAISRYSEVLMMPPKKKIITKYPIPPIQKANNRGLDGEFELNISTNPQKPQQKTITSMMPMIAIMR
jgi:hypothetical protein